MSLAATSVCGRATANWSTTAGWRPPLIRIPRSRRETESRLHLPDRDYVVLAGPLRSALRIGSFAADHFWPQSPNLFWPADQSWCVASEIDFDSTLVGGSLGLIDAILHTPELDAWSITADDSLACNADKINQV